ncbi:hypothetical protein llap_20679 [Limosa lapponica baueri]|uniref:Uncharacterized protein n=1 Tax=Limosa lapponica baueri TaxID=1758121 RepID=A0A2I0T5D3_LIMLA|nr:hypothetical protein llap_20679 [Limosa lapponica baueri]
MTQPQNPFHTCLVDLLLDNISAIVAEAEGGQLAKSHCFDSIADCLGYWDTWDDKFPRLPLEPQEIDILGSIKMDSCVYFNYTKYPRNETYVQDVSPWDPIFRNASQWCNHMGRSVSNPAPADSIPCKLPKGIFFICGDSAWAGTPPRIIGRTCTIDKLTMLTPNITMILNHTHTKEFHRRKRSVNHAFTSKCDDHVTFWQPPTVVFISFFAPGVASAHALTSLRKLGCWLAKQSNATSVALSRLLLDVDSVRHATLQNRTAVDFLLLAHGCGCEDFDGMCSMNLSDHSELIHKSRQQIMSNVQKLRISEGWGWLNDLFNDWGLTGWMRSALQIVLFCIIIFLSQNCTKPCVEHECLRSMVGAALL